VPRHHVCSICVLPSSGTLCPTVPTYVWLLLKFLAHEFSHIHDYFLGIWRSHTCVFLSVNLSYLLSFSLQLGGLRLVEDYMCMYIFAWACFLLYTFSPLSYCESPPWRWCAHRDHIFSQSCASLFHFFFLMCLYFQFFVIICKYSYLNFTDICNGCSRSILSRQWTICFLCRLWSIVVFVCLLEQNLQSTVTLSLFLNHVNCARLLNGDPCYVIFVILSHFLPITMLLCFGCYWCDEAEIGVVLK